MTAELREPGEPDGIPGTQGDPGEPGEQGIQGEPGVDAPVDATFLVTTAHAGLTAAVVVGATPGGELGGTWAAPTVDTTHSGSSHADVQATAASALAAHDSDTTNVHGIANTANLETVTGAQAKVDAAVAALLNSAPGALDTLMELAAALGSDPAFATTVTNALAGKQPLDSDLTAIAALTTTPYGRAFLALADAAALAALIPLGGITNAQLAGSIALSKLLTDPLARANHTGTQLAATISDFAAQVAALIPTPVETLISTTLLASPAATIDLTSIPATYRHLRLVLNGRMAGATGINLVQMRMNNVSSALYTWNELRVNGATVTGNSAYLDTSMRVCHLPDASGLANAPGSADVLLPDYRNTTFFKRATNVGGGFYNGSASGVHTTMFAMWHSTAAIDRLTLIGNSNFIAGTVVSLYGVM